jgi:4-hydroxy-3-polyprenylbenzoate decarboxylase
MTDLIPAQVTDGPARRQRRLVVGITGATGTIIGVRLLESLRELDIVTHLVMSEWAERTLRIETDYSVDEVRALAGVAEQFHNQAAAISSGSFPVSGMVIAPCSMRTVAAVAQGLGDNLLTRAADVMLKERRPLVVVPREMPLSSIHLRNLLALSDLGVSVVPPMPAFYNHPQSVDDIVRHIVARTLDQLGIDNDLTRRWGATRLVHANPGRARRTGSR